MDSDLLAVAALRAISLSIWRQVARDIASPSPARRDPAIAFLMSEMAVVWAQRYDPAIDEPEIVIHALLVAGGRHVRHTRHTAARDSLDAR